MFRAYHLKNNNFLFKHVHKIWSRDLSGSEYVAKKELDQGYVPSKVENNTLKEGYFEPAITNSKPFTLILPPPNITGNLHLGHALTVAVQDVIVRHKRMQGIETVWVPGIDHAGIATQVVVEKKLWKEKQLTRHDIGREEFEKHILKWKNEKAEIIRKQLQKLGISLNWEREMFTMDSSHSGAVVEAFIRLFEAGLIYRADFLINWSCSLQSAISDIEVDHLEIKGPTELSVPGYKKRVKFGVLYNFAYKIHNSDDEIVVATTRPETMLGDVAVAVHPEDERYSRYIGQHLWHPFRKQTIPIICDEFVDRNFGTGAVKITPAHDHTDFQVGKRQNLGILKVIDENGNITNNFNEFSGLKRFEARNAILNELKKLELLRGTKDHEMLIPICSRSKDVVELLIKPQWFVNCQEMAKQAIIEVNENRLNIEPKHYEKTWFNWLGNIKDWCISRQLWWGHRIPAYICHKKDDTKNKVWVSARNESEAKQKASLKLKTSTSDDIILQQDEDVLDTWFSSALLPFSVFSWPSQDTQLIKYYPLNLMETGHDIIFFWVARMVMLGTFLTNKLPFHKILLHGIICDSQGRKMSKSLGNVIDPKDVINGCSLEKLQEGIKDSFNAGILSETELKRAKNEQKKMFPEGIPECGADALKFTLCSHNIGNHFINFDVNECYTNKLFCNKIWQATKFSNAWIAKVLENSEPIKIDNNVLSVMDKWILSKLSNMIKTVNYSIENHEFHFATNALKNFLYYEFCDVYLESTKRNLRDFQSKNAEAQSHCWTLSTCLDTGLRALAPFMPALSQHLHEHLNLHQEIIRTTTFPKKLDYSNEDLEKEIEFLLEIIVAVRRLKKTFSVTAKHKPEVYISFSDETNFNTELLTVVQDLSACYQVALLDKIDLNLKDFVEDSVSASAKIYLKVPDELKKSLQADVPKLEKQKEKLLKELEKLIKMVNGSSYLLNTSSESQQIHSKKITNLQEKIVRVEYIQSFSKQ